MNIESTWCDLEAKMVQDSSAAHHITRAHSIAAKLAAGRVHLNFVISLYRLQLANNRFVSHEHPAGAGSWKELSMLPLLSNHKVLTVTSDQCEYG